MKNILSIDLEEYFHPSEVHRTVGQTEWANLPSRVEASAQIILDLLSESNTKATFFVLGWVARHYPKLVQKIAAQGHEIACHSYDHELVFNLTPSEFRADTLLATRVIEDACGMTPRAYRAPSFSVTTRSIWALEILADCGYTHDSSIYPIIHDRYGVPGFGRFTQTVETPSGPIMEIPPATVLLAGSRVAPVGGGGYLRLLPYRYTAAGIRRINSQDAQPACIYLHPWEFDIDQPRLAAGIVSRVRTYAGLGSMSPKLSRLLQEFQFAPLTSALPNGIPTEVKVAAVSA